VCDRGFSFSTTPVGPPGVKIYLHPQARGSATGSSITGRSRGRSGLTQARSLQQARGSRTFGVPLTQVRQHAEHAIVLFQKLDFFSFAPVGHRPAALPGDDHHIKRRSDSSRVLQRKRRSGTSVVFHGSQAPAEFVMNIETMAPASR